MNRTDLIDAIRELNTTASAEFLAQFPTIELEKYCDHLLELDSHDLTAAARKLQIN